MVSIRFSKHGVGNMGISSLLYGSEKLVTMRTATGYRF
jgi:hypothetical protein